MTEDLNRLWSSSSFCSFQSPFVPREHWSVFCIWLLLRKTDRRRAHHHERVDASSGRRFKFNRSKGWIPPTLPPKSPSSRQTICRAAAAAKGNYLCSRRLAAIFPSWQTSRPPARWHKQDREWTSTTSDLTPTPWGVNAMQKYELSKLFIEFLS